MTISKSIKREAAQLVKLCRVAGVLDDDRVRQVARHVSAARLRKSPALLSQFLRLVRLDRAQHTANVESATPLPADLRMATEASLRRMYGPGLMISFTDQPSLIAGMRIRVGSDLYDGSVLAKLAALEDSF
jgi:F-type H+-transporting ATPase subunit delta